MASSSKFHCKFFSYFGNLLINDTLKGILIIKNEDLEFHGIQETMRIKFEEKEMKKFITQYTL